jgi:hypothetical protein
MPSSRLVSLASTAAVVAGLALLMAAPARAQSPATPARTAAQVREAPPATDGRRNQRVERIHVEDARVVIDEVRYAGQTESIKVQPKSGAPAYEVRPDGPRVWNVLNF